MRAPALIFAAAAVSLLMAASSSSPSPTPQKRVESNAANVVITTDGGAYAVWVDAGLTQEQADLRYASGLITGRHKGSEVHAAQGSGFVTYDMTALATITGTVTGPVDNADAIYTDHTCTAVLNTTCGKRHTGAGTFGFRQRPRFSVVFKWPLTTDTTTTRTWIAMTAAAITTDLPATSFVGLRFKHGTDTNWQCCSGQVVGAQDCTDSGVAPTTQTRHVALLDFADPGFFDAYMDGVRICHKSTNLPLITLVPGSTDDALAQVNMTSLDGVGTPGIFISSVALDRQ